jgi:hypothetical protein
MCMGAGRSIIVSYSTQWLRWFRFLGFACFPPNIASANLYIPRFDPASLAILDRFDRLESLILSNSNYPQAQAQLHAESHQRSPQTLGAAPGSEFQQHHHLLTNQQLGCATSTSLNIRIEAVLEWHPLQNILGNVSFAQVGPETEPVYRGTILGLEDFDSITCYRLLESFWDRVHPKNPILVLNDVKRYINEMVVNGITKDAKSCLVVWSSPCLQCC